MYSILIPQTGTTINWPPADAGRIRIKATLHLDGQGSLPTIEVKLSFKRTPFRRLFKRSDYWCRLRSYAQREAQNTQPLTTAEQAELDRFRPQLGNGSIEQLPPDQLFRRWGSHIACTLHDSMARPNDSKFLFYTVPTFKMRLRKRTQVLNGNFRGIEYKLGLDRHALLVLHAALATDEGQSRIWFEVCWSLLPTALLDLALRGKPRGHARAQERHDLMAVIRCAVFAARELVVRAEKDRALREQLLDCLPSDWFGAEFRKDLLEQEADESGAVAQARLVMLLADRALRPALERYQMEPLIGRDISEVLDRETGDRVDRRQGASTGGRAARPVARRARPLEERPTVVPSRYGWTVAWPPDERARVALPLYRLHGVSGVQGQPVHSESEPWEAAGLSLRLYDALPARTREMFGADAPADGTP
jgi:hypothetical protein